MITSHITNISGGFSVVLLPFRAEIAPKLSVIRAVAGFWPAKSCRGKGAASRENRQLLRRCIPDTRYGVGNDDLFCGKV